MHNLHEIGFKALGEEARALWIFESLLDDKTLSQDQLALDAGVNQSTISRVMHSPAFLRLLMNDMFSRAVSRVQRAIQEGDGDLKVCMWYLELAGKTGLYDSFIPKTDPGAKDRFTDLAEMLAGDDPPMSPEVIAIAERTRTTEINLPKPTPSVVKFQGVSKLDGEAAWFDKAYSDGTKMYIQDDGHGRKYYMQLDPDTDTYTDKLDDKGERIYVQRDGKGRMIDTP